jgi:hypothetical protein
MGIHDYIWLFIENKEEIEVEEAMTTPPPPEEPQAGNCFYFDTCGAEADSPITQGKPRCICHLLAILNLSHLLDALGNRSCVPNKLMHSFLENLITFPLSPILQKGFYYA